jgi:hypothetical protein
MVSLTLEQIASNDCGIAKSSFRQKNKEKHIEKDSALGAIYTSSLFSVKKLVESARI